MTALDLSGHGESGDVDAEAELRALAADALSRTWRSTAHAVAPAPVRTAAGLTIVPDRASADPGDRLHRPDAEHPARALDAALARIRADFGPAVARFVALQLEYPWEEARSGARPRP